MALTITCKRFPTPEPGSSDKNQQRSYQFTYQIEQTDAGAAGSAYDLITAAQQVGTTPHRLPKYGDNPTYEGTTDADSYAQQFQWFRPQFTDRFKLLHVVVDFLPATDGTPGKLPEPNPLNWPVEYWVEWTEEQVVLRDAKNVDNLTAINRAPGTLGRVVNSTGVEFTEPIMRTVFYPVLYAQKNYATLNEIIAKNVAYQETTNSATFFGSPARTAKYLGTESGRIQKINGQSFYVGITRIWFKGETWDRRILNNGWTHFEADNGGNLILLNGKPKRFANLVSDQTQADAIADPDADPNTLCSEPLNLAYDGRLVHPDAPALYLGYRYLTEVDYSGIGIGGG